MLGIFPDAGNPGEVNSNEAGSEVGTGVAVGIGVAVGTGVAVGIGVAVGTGVAVGNGVAVGTGVAVGFGVAVGNGVAVGCGVAVGIAVGVSVAAKVGTILDSGVALALGIGVAVLNGVAATILVGLSVPVAILVGVSWMIRVGTSVGVGVSGRDAARVVVSGISPETNSGSRANLFRFCCPMGWGGVGAVSRVAVLRCPSESGWIPKEFAISQAPLKHSTVTIPVCGSYATLQIVPLGDAVPAGVTTLKGRRSPSNPFSSRKIFPCSSSIMVSRSTANRPNRQTVFGVVRIIRCRF